MHNEVPLGLFVSVFMVGLPSGIVPMPLTFVSLACFLLFFGYYQTVPVFVACVTSFSIVSSSGLVKGLVIQAQQREKEQQEAIDKKSRKPVVDECQDNKKNFINNRDNKLELIPL